MNLSENTKKKCRLLYLVGQLGPGGLERQLIYLLRTLDRDRYLPTVVVWNPNMQEAFFLPELTSLNIPWHTFPPNISKIGKLKAFRRLVNKNSPEVVHSYSSYTNFAAWYATLGSPIIPIGSIRGNFLSERKRSGKILGRICARWPRNQIFNSLAGKDNAERVSGYWKPKKIFFVRNGIDLTKFRPGPLPSGRPQLLSIGRLSSEKRWDRLLRTIAVVAKKGLEFDLYHAGDGPLRTELELQAKQLGLGDIIHFLGVRQDISELCGKSSFLIHTSDDEGCPNVVMEAMACGRAVVATDAGDVPYLVENGKTGFVVPRGDDSLLVESISKLICKYDLSCRMGEAGRIKAENEFGLTRLVSETLATYCSVGWEDF